MTLEEMQSELDKWLAEWKKDLTHDIPYLNYVSDQIDIWMKKVEGYKKSH